VLRRAVGLRTAIATSAGMALATVSLTANVQLGLNLPGASGWIAVLGAGLISVLASFCFAELCGLFPSAAGVKLFIEKAFGERAALFLSILYIGITVLIVGSESYILAQVMSYAMPAVAPGWWILGFLTLMALINLRGISFTGWAQDLTTYSLVAAVVGLSAWALLRPGAPPIEAAFTLGGASGFSLAQAIALGVFLYLGFEWVTPLAEEVRDYAAIPRGMLGGIALLALVYGVLHIGMMSTVPKEILAQSPIPHVLFGEATLGRVGLIAMAAISALASVTSFNAGLMTASRFLYAMGRDGVVPRILSRLHPDWATPWVAVVSLYLVCAGMAALVLRTGSFKLFIFLGAAVECLIFVAMSASLLRLRQTMPNATRIYRAPGGTWLPWLVIAIYGSLFVLIFVPDPAMPGDLDAQTGALALLGIAAALIWAYIVWVVPLLRRSAPSVGSVSPRRPRRP